MTSHAESIIREVMASEAYRTAVATLAAEHDRTVEDIVTLTQVPAPSFQEMARARAFHAMAEAHGLKNLEIDAEGNIRAAPRGGQWSAGLRRGASRYGVSTGHRPYGSA